MTVDMKGLARLGAVSALQAIERERLAIEKAFPDLRRSTAPVARRSSVARVAAPKLHWTQQPKNRARMLQSMRKAWRTRHSRNNSNS